MRTFILSLLFIHLISFGVFSQEKKVLENFNLKQIINEEGNEAIQCWKDFLATKDDTLGSKYWNKEEVEKYGLNDYFLLEKESNFGTDNFVKLMAYGTTKIINLVNNNGSYFITSIFEFPPYEGVDYQMMYIFDVVAKKVDGEFKLYNALTVNKQEVLNKSVVGQLTYYYPDNYTYSLSEAQRLDKYLAKTFKAFDVEYPKIECLTASTASDLYKMKGIHYTINSPRSTPFEIPQGIANSINNIVSMSGGKQFYPHEFLHILFYEVNPKTNMWALEGACTYFGLSRGEEFGFHLKKIQESLDAGNEIDFSELLKTNKFDEMTSYRYAIGGLVVSLLFDKGSYDLVKKFIVETDATEESYYKFIEEYLGWKKEDLDATVKKAMKDYLQKNQ
ncbi:hypothetical protein KMW28_06375 [Flammeovirga yaeyamensis]|uniref:Caspase family p10 domain-containing protein n=1 Tax=Flammeovirga yaeyamensis TaxID=367791 RepID=A0AAX1NC21_9BACT|nr:hypothetical protein [Flammeovirga yaeyamensis]MBB3697798.1 hypothetical protein [Flammeovirga yaeyamensis]NMF35846.1 hypothetical protein [Flammeovirga yaeyamensis]QWG03203.1 hypothetical protein KMW28_06375 [Flammeovirga yaeyamensis]